MTEQLSHPSPSTEHKPSSLEAEEFERHFELEIDAPAQETEVPPSVDTRETSSMAGRVRAAAERFATRLEKHAISRAHNAALKEYRDRDHSAYVDHVISLASGDENTEAQEFNSNLLRKEERRSDREELLEGATLQLRALGGLALEKTVDTSKNAGYIALGAGVLGYEKAKYTVRGVGNILKAEASYHINDARLKHGQKRDAKQFVRNYQKETKRFDKQAEKEAQLQVKVDRKEMKQAIREDKRFERSMRNKARVEKVVGAVERNIDRAANTKRRLGSLAASLEQMGRGEQAYVPRAEQREKAAAEEMKKQTEKQQSKRPTPHDMPKRRPTAQAKKGPDVVHKITNL